MTVTAKTTRVQYTGNGLVATYAYTWKILDDGDLVVISTDTTGADTTLVLGTGYTVTGAGNDSGGNVVLSANLASGYLLTLYMGMDIEQPTDLTNQASPFLERIESALDRQALISQQLAEELGRCIKNDPVAGSELTFADIEADAAAAAAARTGAETAQGLAEDARDLAQAAAASVPSFGAFGLTLAETTTASNARAALNLGSAAVADTGTSAGNVVTLAAGAALVAPALLDISGAAAGQIKFPATMNPSADANTLDDYEQGTFSPTIAGSTAAGVGTYTFNSGTYTKIGRLVHVSILMEWTAHTGTGNMRIAGLPFATGASHAVPIAYANGLTITGVPVGQISGSSSIILMYAMNNGSTSPLAMDTAATMYLNFSYYTA